MNFKCIYTAILLITINGCSTPDNTDIKTNITLNKIGESAEKAKRYNYAVSVYQEALKRDPNNIITIEKLAKNLNITHQYQRASSICKIGLKTNPNNIQLLDLLSSSLLADGNINNALIWIDKTLQITHGQDINALNNLGIIYDSIQNHKKAQHCYIASLNIDPKNNKTLNNYGLSLALSNKTNQAFEKLLAANTFTDSQISMANINLIKKLHSKNKHYSKKLQKTLFKKLHKLNKNSTATIHKLWQKYCQNSSSIV